MTAGGKRAGAGRPPVGPRFEIRLPAERINELDLEAHRLGVTRTELIRRILGEWLEAR